RPRGTAHAKSAHENKHPTGQRAERYRRGERTGDHSGHPQRGTRSLEVGGPETRDGQGRPGGGGAQPGGELARGPAVRTSAGGGQLSFRASANAGLRPETGEFLGYHTNPHTVKAELIRICGVDLTSIDGIDVITAQTILSEVGTDMSGFATENHFASWL